MRVRYINDIPRAPTLENLLFGNDRLTPDANSSVFLNVQGFIADTTRFDDYQLSYILLDLIILIFFIILYTYSTDLLVI